MITTTEQFTLVVILRFCAAHKIEGYQGRCANLHGHNYKVEIEVCGQQLNDIGLLIDCETIKKRLKQVIDLLDHSYLNELPAFEGISTSAENIARYIYQQCAKKINNEGVRVEAIKLWETDNFFVRYSQHG